MELQLKNANVASGDTLEGTATLTLNNDVKGKSVVATLFAEKTQVTFQEAPFEKGSFENVERKRQSTTLVYTKSETLDNEKLYTKQNGPYQYRFSFVIPQTNAPPSGITGVLMSVASMVGGMLGIGGPTRWYIKVELNHDAMLSVPIETKQEIYIVSQQPSAVQLPQQPQQQTPQQPQQNTGGQV